MYVRRTLVLLTPNLAFGLTASGTSADNPKVAATGSSAGSDPASPSDSPQTSDGPVDISLPTTLDVSKFCGAVDEKAVTAAIGVPIAKRSTKGFDPKKNYCLRQPATRVGGGGLQQACSRPPSFLCTSIPTPGCIPGPSACWRQCDCIRRRGVPRMGRGHLMDEAASAKCCASIHLPPCIFCW